MFIKLIGALANTSRLGIFSSRSFLAYNSN